MNPELETRLRAAGLDPQAVEDLVRTALAEDGDRDVTSEPIFPPDRWAAADFVTRSDGVVAGLPVAELAVEIVAPDAKIVRVAADGDRIRAGDVLLSVRAPLLGLLRAERTALNFLTHLSGIATITRRWADAAAPAKVRDTRKTLPGLRLLQKYAVRCGGGVNQRMSLADAALIKDNHIAAAGSLSRAYAAVRAPGVGVQVECDTLEQVREALDAGARSILLDNMTPAEMAEAVRICGGRAVLEASGGLTFDRARDVAEAGVDYLSVGALTHSAAALDIGLDLTERRAQGE